LALHRPLVARRGREKDGREGKMKGARRKNEEGRERGEGLGHSEHNSWISPCVSGESAAS